MRRGRRLGIDVGTVRIGVAVCDGDGLLATPVTTVERRGRPVVEIAALCEEYEPIELVVGHPVTLSGRSEQAATAVEAFAQELADGCGRPVRLVDERLSTAAASRDLRAAGRSARQQRSVIDQQAAVRILQDALDAERAADLPPGRVLAPGAGDRPAPGGV